jgi:hypothetical protein
LNDDIALQLLNEMKEVNAKTDKMIVLLKVVADKMDKV